MFLVKLYCAIFVMSHILSKILSFCAIEYKQNILTISLTGYCEYHADDTERYLNTPLSTFRNGNFINRRSAYCAKYFEQSRKNSKITPIDFYHKVVETCKRNLHTKEMSFANGPEVYIRSKSHPWKYSLHDINDLSSRLKKSHPDLTKRNFSEFISADCEAWLMGTFDTPSQFNKEHTMLHTLF